MEGYAPKLLIDGAHNPAGIETLRKSMDYYFPGEKRIFVFGVLHDKDYREMFKILLKPDDILILTTPESDRAANPLEIIELPEVAQKEAVAEPEEALKRGIELAKELDISQGLAYKMIAQWNEKLKAKGYTTVGGRVSRRYYQEKIYGAGEE